MPRKRRYFRSNKLYEVCFRLSEGLPLVPTTYMSLIIESILARGAELFPVILCNDQWMPNHPHMFVIAKDSKQFTAFYGYVRKEITEYIKCLLGLKRLTLRDGAVQATEILDLPKAIEKLVYFFNNPTKPHLVGTADKSPYLSSWKLFLNSPKAINTKIERNIPKMQRNYIVKLPTPSLTERQDRIYSENLKAKAKNKITITYHPYYWLSCFNCEDGDIDNIVEEVKNKVKENEVIYSEERAKKNIKVVGALKLKLQSIAKSYKPKKYSQGTLLFISSDPNLRISLIQEYKEFCEQCEDAYNKWKNGDFLAQWPPNAFKPPLPPMMNIYTC